MKILVINAGSSSVKYQLIDMKNQKVLAKGYCEKIGLKDSFNTHKANGFADKIERYMKNHEDALNLIMELLVDPKYGTLKTLDEIDAIGHRVLHGGEIYKKSMLVDDEVIKNITSLIPFGPLHQSANLMGINACRKVMPNKINVAVFDTAFHSTMPKHAFLYGLPMEDYTKYKLRKYGFHGTSHSFVSKKLAELEGSLKNKKVVTCHLGSGSSVTAILNGKSVDTSMGFTPLEGLIMGTRSGDIDPAVIEVLMEKHNLSAKEAIQYLNKSCGLAGVSGGFSDLRDLHKAAETSDDAKTAVMMLGYRVRKYIGSYAAAMGGLDYIVFTGGVGENDNVIRDLATKNLEFMGVSMNKAKNDHFKRGEIQVISKKNSKVKVYIIPTDEELMIAKDTQSIFKRTKNK